MKFTIKSIGLFISTKGKRMILKTVRVWGMKVWYDMHYPTLKVYVPDTLADASQILTNTVEWNSGIIISFDFKTGFRCRTMS